MALSSAGMAKVPGRRLVCYVLYNVIMSEHLTGAYKATPTFRLRCYVLYGVIMSEWLVLHALCA